MKKEQYDVVVIGAGPAGAVAAAMLVRKGRKVLILEKMHFPRFSIGESLLPQCMEFLREAGLEGTVDQHAASLAFQYKDGAAFYKSGAYTEFDFTKKFSKGRGTTFQVKRADFDKLLADGAEKAGAEIRYGHQVNDVDVKVQQPILTVENEDGVAYQVECKFLLDASGFGRVLPRLLDLETPSNFPIRQSYFTHIKDNIDDPSFDRNKILITVHPKHSDIWYWLIPFDDGTASVGVVGEPEQFNDDYGSNDELLNAFLRQSPNLEKLLANATLINPVRTIKGYSANVKRLQGGNFALLGNAGEFLDPVFSSGVTIALKSASLIAPLVDKYLDGEQVDFEADYSTPLKKGVNCFKTFVTAWYEGGFQDIIFYQDQDEKIREMICSILAGYAWDEENPYVAQSERRFKVLVDICRTE
ncbi:NAD(P)/FAD-dependent oxidoreductase [Flocculibacter collagenilyticus]|uniref:NAD(P)/FAD-dependent oxidoreductase n=1 Tax=Flocculibacter collagenilyticus TaxID=2744479 RepID=UPI0018F2A2ED|nr:NAD(P)/FAD-dependent oxidoreductase [Flocculibacter collagenilyticus]